MIDFLLKWINDKLVKLDINNIKWSKQHKKKQNKYDVNDHKLEKNYR